MTEQTYRIKPLEWHEDSRSPGMLYADTVAGRDSAGIGEIDGKVALWTLGRSADFPGTIEAAKALAQKYHDEELIRRFLDPTPCKEPN